MKIKTEEAFSLIQKPGNSDLRILILTPIYLNVNEEVLEIKQGSKFSISLYEKLRAAKVEEIDVFCHDGLYSKLSESFPSNYRFPAGRKNIVDLDKIIEKIELCNSLSKRKRVVISLTEIYKKDNEAYIACFKLRGKTGWKKVE